MIKVKHTLHYFSHQLQLRQSETRNIFFKQISKAYKSVKRVVDKLERREKQSPSSKPQLSPEKRYVQVLQNLRFATIDMEDSKTN